MLNIKAINKAGGVDFSMKIDGRGIDILKETLATFKGMLDAIKNESEDMYVDLLLGLAIMVSERGKVYETDEESEKWA